MIRRSKRSPSINSNLVCGCNTLYLYLKADKSRMGNCRSGDGEVAKPTPTTGELLTMPHLLTHHHQIFLLLAHVGV